jgi:hypothetical protein
MCEVHDRRREGVWRLPLQRGLPQPLRLRDRALERLPERDEGPRVLRRQGLASSAGAHRPPGHTSSRCSSTTSSLSLVYTTDEVMAYLPASMRRPGRSPPFSTGTRRPWSPTSTSPLPAYKALTEARSAFTKAYEEAGVRDHCREDLAGRSRRARAAA